LWVANAEQKWFGLQWACALQVVSALFVSVWDFALCFAAGHLCLAECGVALAFWRLAKQITTIESVIGHLDITFEECTL
jgi:hypothetical protein